VEHQNTVSYNMSYRMLQYVMRILEHFVGQQKAQARKKSFQLPAVLPVIIGASCPPPSMPYFATIGSNTFGVATDVPDCSPGFVCSDSVKSRTLAFSLRVTPAFSGAPALAA